MRPLILCVDDEQDITDLVQFHLTRDGCEVLTAASGREALAKVEHRRPDLILLDLMLPDVDGFGVLELLRLEPLNPAISIVILTGWATSEARDLGLKLGAAEYLVKPFGLGELTACIRRSLAPRCDAPPC